MVQESVGDQDRLPLSWSLAFQNDRKRRCFGKTLHRHRLHGCFIIQLFSDNMKVQWGVLEAWGGVESALHTPRSRFPANGCGGRVRHRDRRAKIMKLPG